MVDKALVLENRRGILSSKRKQECQTQQNTNSRPRINVDSSPARPIFRPAPQSSQPMPRSAVKGFVTPQQQMIPCPNLFQTPNTGNQSAQGTPTTPNATPNKENTTCFNCGQKGHMLTVALADINHPPQPQERLHRQAIMETLPRPKLSRTTLNGEWIKWLWRKLRTPKSWSPVHLSSNPFRLSRSSLSFLFCSWESQDEIPVKGGSPVTPQNFKFWNVTKIH
jgi:hypothetical protein